MKKSSNQLVTQFVRNLKNHLETNHGIKVPYAALRASYLAAGGKNPHAFKDSSSDAEKRLIQQAEELQRLRALLKEAPAYFSPMHDFEGRKKAWLEKADLIKCERTLYLVADELGCLENLALDPDGVYVLNGFQFGADSDAELTGLDAQVPSVKRYGYPQYVNDPGQFFGDRFNLRVAPLLETATRDTLDDSGDQAIVVVTMSAAQWDQILRFALEGDSTFEADLAEWVGHHYRVNFSTASPKAKLEWAQRFLDSIAEYSDLLEAIA